MQSILLLLLPLLAAASPSPVRASKRQNPLDMLKELGSNPGMLAGMLSDKKPSKVIDMPAQVRPGAATRKRLVWGPYNFKPAANGKDAHSHGGSKGGGGMQMDPDGQVTLARLSGFCSDCTVLHGAAYVAHEDGSRVDVNEGAYLHHLLVLNQGKQDGSYYNCSTSAAPATKAAMASSYFLGSGVDESEYFFTTPDGKYNSGYYIPKGQGFMMQNEIVNYSPKPTTWYIAADYEYIPGKPAGLEDVSVTDFNVNTCTGFFGAGYKPPNGEKKYTKTSPKFVMNQDGTILHAMGHLHDGGTSIQLLVNDKLVCDSKATYGGKQGTFTNDQGQKWESISSMSTCRDPVKVKQGDVLTMKSIYDLVLHPLRESTTGQEMEEMGIYTLFFAKPAQK